MLETYLRKLASWLLSSALAFSSSDIRPWGRAMLAELKHVRGGWASLSWGAGGFSLIVTQSFVSLFKKQSGGRTVSSKQLILAGEGAMRKVTALLAGISVATFLLLLLAPTFRQAMEISLGSWQAGINNGASYNHALLKIAAQARKDHDAEAMVFVALRVWNHPETAEQLADEAVRTNPQLTWVYMIFGSPYHSTADAGKKVQQLEAWDPQNAYPYLIEADQISFRLCKNHNFYNCDALGLVKDDPRWFEVMRSAFRAEKYDSYLAKRLDLDRSAVLRYHLHDPLLLSSAYMLRYGMGGNERTYAKYLFDLGKVFEAKGDLKRALQNYSKVAHFCQTVRLEAQTDLERFAIDKPQIEAYQRLRSVAQKLGNPSESDILSYEILQLGQEAQRARETRHAVDGYRWVGSIVQASSLVVVISAGLVLIWAASKVSYRFIAHSKASHWSSVLSSAGTLGAVGLLFGLLTLYLNYQPYAEAYSHFMANTGVGEFRSFYLMFSNFWNVPGSMQRLWYSNILGLYFWCTFVALATGALAFIVTYRFRKDFRLHSAG